MSYLLGKGGIVSAQDLYSEDDNFIIGSDLEAERLRRDARQFHRSRFSETRRKAHYARLQNASLKVALETTEKRMEQKKSIAIREIERSRVEILKQIESYQGLSAARRGSLPGTSLRATLATGETRARLLPLQPFARRRRQRKDTRTSIEQEIWMLDKEDSWMRQKGESPSGIMGFVSKNESLKGQGTPLDESRRTSLEVTGDMAIVDDGRRAHAALSGLLQIPPSREVLFSESGLPSRASPSQEGFENAPRPVSHTLSSLQAGLESRAPSVAQETLQQGSVEGSTDLPAIDGTLRHARRGSNGTSIYTSSHHLSNHTLSHHPCNNSLSRHLSVLSRKSAIQRKTPVLRVSSSRRSGSQRGNSSRIASARTVQEEERAKVHQAKLQLNQKLAQDTKKRVWKDFDDLLKGFSKFLNVGQNYERPEPAVIDDQLMTTRDMRNKRLPINPTSSLSSLYFRHGPLDDYVIRLC
ncbi:uncharacterized protein LOC5517041 [Nematostella vectensis]|uniref:uncharacterized protein LOC5517041 n=1 Tax=Nematostella vectensis TaxID=45351 RepID=UPI002077746D|nr:uncharacterized protein LOC5517041 [Nematostella vectensis]